MVKMLRNHGSFSRSALALMVSFSACSGASTGGENTPGDLPGDEDPDVPVETAGCKTNATFVRSPMRRLTAVEFDYAAADLFGEAGATGVELLPSDEITAGYANNSVITLQPNQVEKFQSAARRIAEGTVTRVDKLVPCSGDKEKCALDFIDRVGRRAMRRPLETEESDLFAKMYRDKAKATDHAQGIRLIVETMLQYPSFMYRPIVGVETAKDGVRKLTKWELAGRLSFFLWNSVPDDELMESAEAGKLETPSGIREQTERMMQDDRFDRSLKAFSVQWFDVGAIAPDKNPADFPNFNQEVWGSMRDGLAQFFAHAVRNGGDMTTLMTGPFAFANKKTATIYGVPAKSDTLELFDTNPAQRGGLMTQAGVMAALGNTEVSRPIKRGLFVRNRLLCQDPPPPPPEGVPPFEAAGDNLTVREMLEAHRADPTCASCHTFFDPPGLAFSHFDGVGQYHEMEKGKKVDASGTLIDTDVDGDFTNAIEFMNMLKDSSLVAACVSTQIFRFAIGRLEEDGDKCAQEATVKQFADSQQSLPGLFTSIATSDSFRFTGSETP